MLFSLITFKLLEWGKVKNHPVHLISKDGKKSPSSFIPFCDFGGNMSAMGTLIDHFDVPVCNAFGEKILNDQLCYEVDLNIFTNKGNIEKELKSGFAFIIDYNEDRQFTFDMEDMSEKDEDLVSKIVKSDDKGHAYIYLNTIGKCVDLLLY